MWQLNSMAERRRCQAGTGRVGDDRGVEALGATPCNTSTIGRSPW
jgi:hypothetical protein